LCAKFPKSSAIDSMFLEDLVGSELVRRLHGLTSCGFRR
jgi:hypothetical protein